MTANTIPTRVCDIRHEADGVLSFALERVDGELFAPWTPGAHVDIVVAPGLNRQYSLCGDPADRRTIRFAVLKEPQSRGGSRALHENVAVGAVLPMIDIRNNFPVQDADQYLLIAGGIGITPILAMIREMERTGRDWRLLYGGRSLASMAFLDALTVYGDKVMIRPEDQHGLLDLAGWIGAAKPGKQVYCCGPEPLIKAVETYCAGWPEAALQIERFRPKEQVMSGVDTAFEVELKRKGLVVQVAANQSIADALETVGVHIPRSCNEGTCGTCLTKLVYGEPDHRDSFLRPKQRAEGNRILVCCSRALSSRLVLDI